jgi:hypothetical protein
MILAAARGAAHAGRRILPANIVPTAHARPKRRLERDQRE